MRAITFILASVTLVLLTGCAPTQQQRGAVSVPASLVLGKTVGTATMTDGAALPVRIWRPSGASKAMVVALHGFNDYSNAFSELGPVLTKRGISVYAYDQRGFGEAPNLGIWPGQELLIRDFRTVVELVRAEQPGVPVIGLGESMGGAVIMAALGAYHRPTIDGAILSAPAVRGREVLGPFAAGTLEAVAHLVPSAVLQPRNLNVHPSDNIDALRALARDPLFIKETRVDAVYGLVGLMDRALSVTYALDTVPMLILYGAKDDIVPRDAACLMLSRLPRPRVGVPPSWRVALYPNGYHLLFRDLGGAKVAADIASFATRPSAPLPSGYEATPHAPLNQSKPLADFCGTR